MGVVAFLGSLRCSVYEESLARPERDAAWVGETGGAGDGSSGVEDSIPGDRRESGPADATEIADGSRDREVTSETDSSRVDTSHDTSRDGMATVDATQPDGTVSGDGDVRSDDTGQDRAGDNDASGRNDTADSSDASTDAGIADASAGDTDDARDGGPVVGILYNIVAQHSGKCMTVLGNLPLDGTDIVQWTCDGSASQVFRLQASATGSVTIEHEASKACTDVEDSGVFDGTNVALWHCNGTAAQLFTLAPAGAASFFTITNTNSQKCVDVDAAGMADWTNIQIYTCNGAANQSWQFVEVGSDR